MLDVAGVKDQPTATSCGFALGPRINAAGRISDSGLGLRLLLTQDPVEAQVLANTLDAVNRERQQVEASIMQSAMDQAAAQADSGRAVLFVSGQDWHPGVVGIVCRPHQGAFSNRPTLVGAIADGQVKGSGRSVPGCDLGGAVIAARQNGLLTSGGGHAMAAGFALPKGEIGPLHAFLEDRLAQAASLPRAADLAVDGTVSVAGATADLAHHLARLAPFGAGNAEPLLVLSRARVVRSDRIGREAGTIRAWVEGEGGGPRVKALLFRASEDALCQALDRPGPPLDLAGHLRSESWNGTLSTSFFVTDAAHVGKAHVEAGPDGVAGQA